jgi:hypothetical protein
VFEDRPSDSPLVERVWRCHSERAGTFMSVAASHCEMVLTRHRGKMLVTLRGPETRPTTADCPADGEWLGIRFSLGTFLPHHPAATLIDRSDVNLPGATGRSFWLQGSAWEYPDFENAETLVTRLLRAGVLARDPAVSAALQGEWRGAVPALYATALPAGDRDDPRRLSADRTGPVCHDPSQTGGLHPRHRPRGRILRSGPPQPIAPAPDRRDPRAAPGAGEAVVVLTRPTRCAEPILPRLRPALRFL